MKMLKIVHWLGCFMLLCGSTVYLLTDWSLELQGMLLIATSIGLGLVFMSPYPVVLVIEWMKRQQELN
ncbi:hypothetical protein LZP73_05395 [Shewanella sp. AS16]|uniref:hypothetical protein n=1 Tax=Shewanella sp. AS16 TaxID=2907625 RepID=UPI001F2D1386|nr:hypothetical protein [Shewanella sp. AS16]MCE9685650.1 hypothetical protein [Shewanella sp. AS16]